MRPDYSQRDGHRGRKLAAILAMAREFGGAGEGFAFGGRGGGRGGPFGGGGPRGGGGGRGRRGRFDRAELRLVLLSLIAGEPRHGYDLIRAMEEQSGGAYAPSPGVIYPALSLLADEGLIAEQAGGEGRRRFAITEAGTAELAAQGPAVAAALQRLTELAERAERTRAPQVERATANLHTALRQRLSAGGDADLPHAIAEILDEATRRIERL